jgi:hypothetical protein
MTLRDCLRNALRRNSDPDRGGKMRTALLIALMLPGWLCGCERKDKMPTPSVQSAPSVPAPSAAPVNNK